MQQQMHQALLQAYHVEGENISDRAVLKKVAKSIGFDGEAVDQALLSDAAGRQLLDLSERVRRYQVRSVPAFIFNENRLVSGSNSTEFFEQLIRSEFLAEDSVGKPVEEAI